MDDMNGNKLFRLPQETRDQVYTEVVRGTKYRIIDHDGLLHFPLLTFPLRLLDYKLPAYAGLLRSCKSISTELQQVLYRKGVFRAHLCRYGYDNAPSPRPDDFARFQKIEIILDLSIPSDSHNSTQDSEQVDRYYREWFESFGGSGAYRDSCRIKFESYRLDKLRHTTIFRKFLLAFRAFTGFRTVIVELEDLANDQAGIDRVQAPEPAGERTEALKRCIETGLEAYLGHCKYYDCGHVRCLEFHPRTQAPRELSCASYADAPQD